MARLLRDLDYSRLIQSDNLNQVITNDRTLLVGAEQSAQTEMRSYLEQRYQVNRVFSDTTQFVLSAVYHGKDLVEYTEAAFDYTVDYVSGQRVVWTDGSIYEKTDSSPAQGLTPDFSQEWELVCPDRTLFYVKLPVPEWTERTYSTGDQVWYNDVVYVAKQNVPDSNQIVPSINTFGGSPVASTFPILPSDVRYWTTQSTFTVTGHLPTDATYWTQGDNRNQLIVQFLIDITLYHLHARINPRNVPELRMIRYDGNNSQQNGGAIAWLKRVAYGELNAELPENVPTSGLSIEWGSERKINNGY